MRKRVAIVIGVVVTGVIVAYFIRSPSSDKQEASAGTAPAAATVRQQSQKQADDAGTGAPTAGTLRVASSPPTGERPRDVCWELADRRRAREQAGRDAEPKDPAWAYPMEQKLREFTMPRFQADQIDLIAIDCKTSFCEIRAGGSPEVSEAFNKVIGVVPGKPWNDFTGWSITHDTESGKRLHYARVSRKQSNPAPQELDDMQRAVLRAEEQALAACTAQQIERQERELAARNAEPRDSSWADPMEQLLRQHITAQLVKHPFGHMEIACRATFCEIKASGQKMDSYLAFQKVAQEVGSEPWANLRNGEGGGSAYGESWKQEYTLYRRESR